MRKVTKDEVIEKYKDALRIKSTFGHPFTLDLSTLHGNGSSWYVKDGVDMVRNIYTATENEPWGEIITFKAKSNVVTDEHLKHFNYEYPKEVLELWCKEQVLQGNKFDPTKLKKDKGSGGVLWRTSTQGHSFWQRIIEDKMFDSARIPAPRPTEYAYKHNYPPKVNETKKVVWYRIVKPLHYDGEPRVLVKSSKPLPEVGDISWEITPITGKSIDCIHLERNKFSANIDKSCVVEIDNPYDSKPTVHGGSWMGLTSENHLGKSFVINSDNAGSIQLPWETHTYSSKTELVPKKESSSMLKKIGEPIIFKKKKERKRNLIITK